MASFCWHGFVRCVGNRADEPDRARYRTHSQVETIKFENLLTLEEREKAARVPAVSETEAQYIKEGRWDMIAEEQMRKDMEMDEKLRQEEERLKKEEDAYYASKREAARKTKRNMNGIGSGGGGGEKGRSAGLVTTQPKSTTGSTKLFVSLDEEEDFDTFLKSVQTKAPTVAAGDSPLTTQKSLHSITSDNESSTEEELDFGYWEKAAVPQKTTPITTTEGSEGLRTGVTGNLKEIDLDLL